ncbi:hypothetical protein L218DRAFT_948825 [Marasmius fiardii PR-910]|nr:hypothetical protein L218DRAFT_948825 [Marasmius fiardii PR-910]
MLNGKWQNLALGSVTATVKKLDDQRTIYITVAPLGKKAQWQDKDKVTGKEALHGKAVNVNGMLHFKDFNTVAKGHYANYNNDRIVFYENDWTGTDFVAFPLNLGQETSKFKPAPPPSIRTLAGRAPRGTPPAASGLQNDKRSDGMASTRIQHFSKPRPVNVFDSDIQIASLQVCDPPNGFRLSVHLHKETSFSTGPHGTWHHQ